MRNAEEDLEFINTNRFKGSKVKEIIEYWINKSKELNDIEYIRGYKDGYKDGSQQTFNSLMENNYQL